MSKKYWGAFWLAAVFLLFFLNGSLPITDNVECNYALTAKEMVLSGDYTSPQIFGKYWYDKPIMFYWLTALGFKIFGFTEFGARFFPAVFGLLSLALTVFAGRKLYSDKTGFFSAAILLTSIEFFFLSKFIITDSILFFFFNGALLFFYLAYSTENKNYYYGTYIFSALATLTKGPIGFLLPGLIIVVFLLFERNWRELKRAKLISGTILFLLIGMPWYYAMWQLHGEAFVGNFLGTHNVLRATVSEHPKDNVFYYYTMIICGAFFPFILLVPGTIKNILYSQNKFTFPPKKELFLLLWTIIVFGFYQNMATKYITYIYPILMPLALLVGQYITEKADELGIKWPLAIYIVIFAVISIGTTQLITAGKVMVPKIEDIQIVAIITFALGGLLLYHYLKTKKAEKIILCWLVLAFAFDVVTIGLFAKPVAEERTTKLMGAYIKSNIPQEEYLGAWGRYPTSCVYYSDHQLIYLIKKEKEEKYKPKEFSWTGKNVMPYEIVDGLKDKKGKINLVVYGEDNVLEIKQLVERQWQEKRFSEDWYLLRSDN